MAVPHFDPILLEFLQYNVLSLTLLFGLITAIAKTFKLTKIVELVSNIKGVILSVKKVKPSNIKGVAENVGEKAEESYKLPEV